MSTNTTNYNLKKPDATENYDVADQNDNMDIIDAALKPTADSALVPSGLVGKMQEWVSWITNRIKAITGKTNWYDAPATTLETANTHMNAAAPHEGHETPTGAQAKANTAEANAKNYTDGLAVTKAEANAFESHLAENAKFTMDYEYQNATVIGTQLRLARQGTSKRIPFMLADDLSGGVITISLDMGVTSLPLKNIDGVTLSELSKGFAEVVDNTTFFTYAPKGGNKINSIVESYIVAAGENVSAGDFIEFIDGKVKKCDAYPNYRDLTTLQIGIPCAVQLDETRVFVCYSAAGGTTVNGNVITIGPHLFKIGPVVSVINTAYTVIAAVLVSPEKILVAYGGYIKILTVNGDSITSGVAIAYDEGNSPQYLDLCKLDIDRVLVVWRQYASPYNPRAIIASINGTTLSTGILLGIETVGTGDFIKCSQVDINKAIVTYSVNNNAPRAVILTASGVTLTKGTPLVFDATINAGYLGVGALNTTSALIVYSDGTINGSATAIVLSISGYTLLAATPVVYANTAQFTKLKCGLTPPSWGEQCAIVSYRGSDTSIHASLLTISETYISQTNDILIETYPSTLNELSVISGNKVVLIYGNTVGRGIVLNSDGVVISLEVYYKAEGVAKTSAIENESINLFLPNY